MARLAGAPGAVAAAGIGPRPLRLKRIHRRAVLTAIEAEQTTLYCLVQQHAATTFFAQAEDAAGADLPQFVKHEFLECGILAHGFLKLRCGECGHDQLLAFSCERRGFCHSHGARRMSRTASHLVKDSGRAAQKPQVMTGSNWPSPTTHEQ